MGTIADKLLYLGETKADLRATLNDLFGLSLDESTPFRHYANEADMARVRAMFANGELGGYWEPSPETLFVESNGTGAASVGAVAGYWGNLIPGGPAAIQATTANKPYLRQTPQTNRYWLDGNTVTANLTATFSSTLGSSCTIATLDPELGVQWLEGQTIGTTRNLITPYAYHGPTLIINRALTVAEKAIVERVMMRKAPELGAELYPQPSFDSAVNLTLDPSWSVFDGKAVSNGTGFVRAPGSLPSSTSSYFAKLSIVERSAGSIYLPYDGKGANIVLKIAIGEYRRTFRPAGVFDSTIYLYGIGFVGSVDNVSVKEIL